MLIIFLALFTIDVSLNENNMWKKNVLNILSETTEIHSVYLSEVFQSIVQKKHKNLDKFIFIHFVIKVIILQLESVRHQRVSRKLRPRKLRPQTQKTQTFRCLENSDLKNSDPWVSRKLRPKKLDTTFWGPDTSLLEVELDYQEVCSSK